ncbi:MAG: trypsin-like serine peptidase [Janthinobacterium lividum]
MTATSTNPADSVVSITSQVVSGNTVITEQGSGVLIAPDEVLTTAHLVYDSTGKFFTSTQVSAGSQGATVYGTSSAQTIHAEPDQDWTQLSNAKDDFAIIHLAAAITGVPVMSLGSGFAGGAVTVTGYPAATSGRQDSLDETVGAVAGYNGVLQGTALGAPGDAHGASGGAVWTQVGGAATVVGLTQSQGSGSTGYFTQLTAADVAQIASWMVQDEAQPTATAASATAAVTTSSATAPPASTASAALAPPVLSPAAAGSAADRTSTTADAIAFLSSDARQFNLIVSHASIDHATSRVVALLQQDAALGVGCGFDDVASFALSQVGNNGASRNLAAALLEGLVWGHDGGAASAVVAGVSAQDPGLVSYHGSQQSAQAGALLGHALLTHGY